MRFKNSSATRVSAQNVLASPINCRMPSSTLFDYVCLPCQCLLTSANCQSLCNLVRIPHFPTHYRNLVLTHSPACSCSVLERDINNHLDSGCSEYKLTRSAASGSQLQAKDESKGKLAPIFSQGQGSNSAAISSEINSEGPSKKKRKVDTSSLAVTQPAFSGQKYANKRTFDPTTKTSAPLAERLRPQRLDEFVGQEHLTGPNSLLRNLLGSGNLGSIIFWGPPG